MKLLYFLFATLFLLTSVNAQIVSIPDANFKAKLIALGVDTNADGNIQESEVSSKTSLDLNVSNISDLTGIEAFTSLNYLSARGNTISDLTKLNGLVNLTFLDCNANAVVSIVGMNDLPNLQYLYLNNNPITTLAGIANLPSIVSLNCYSCSQLSDVSAILSLPLLNSLDISYSFQVPLATINSLTHLTFLSCRGIMSSTSYISNLNGLTTLSIGNNNLSSLNLSYFPNLMELYCDDNMLTTLNLTAVPNLIRLDCTSNHLSVLNITSLTNLQTLDCGQNNLTTLNVSGLVNLSRLVCNNNHIANLDFTGLTQLRLVNCSGNNLTTIDVSNQHILQGIICDDMPTLISAFIKNGSTDYFNNYQPFGFSNCPHLAYVCVDDAYITTIQAMVPPTCSVNSYCSFTPGGVFYTIKGNNRFDSDNNGCTTADFDYPNLKLSFSDGFQTSTFFADGGNYHYDVEAGNYTTVPTIENPLYFNITPATSSVNFPAVTSPYTQDFCITPNGIHNDLEVNLFPISIARPGFDAQYKIIFKNKGTQSQSGTISIYFNDAILNLVNAVPAVSAQLTDSLSWNFINLAPFESREISITLNVNSPLQIPPINGGDVLYFTTSINSVLTDETPNDNTVVLNQTVINSFDPNDKTCLEGSTITPEMVGKEVHYMIRFENTGTANAENIVVKDVIDTEKFDVNSLIPIDGSHPFVTKISNTNKVEFIFENINLPFDDANNDGYVAFKIKTKSDLVIGNSFSNTASIYFDYNFPIITNTATTTVALLANQDFEFEQYFKIYPNPAHDVLNIEMKKTIEVTSINIYNTLGQVVIVIPNAQQTKSVDVSSLKTGNYLMKVNSDKGSSSVKFVKM